METRSGSINGWTIVSLSVAAIGVIISLFSVCASHRAAKAAENSASVAQESWQLERDLSRTSLRVEPISNKLVHTAGDKYDVHIHVSMQNVGREEGTLVKTDIVGINMKTHVVVPSMGSKTEFPLAPGQTFNQKIDIKDLLLNPSPSQYEGHGIVIVVRYHGNCIKPEEIRVARLIYLWNGIDLTIMSEAEFKRIERFLSEDFRKIR